MQRVQVTSGGTAVDNKVELTSLTLDDNAATAQYSAVRVYLSTTASTTLPANAVQIGRTPIGTIWTGATATTIVLSSGTTSQRTVVTGTPAYVYVLYDMLAGQAPNTAQSHVTAIGVSAPDTGASGLNYSSNLITLQSVGAKATVTTCQDCHGMNLLDNATRSAATGSFLGSHNKHVDSLAYGCTYCHVDSAASYTMGHRNNNINMTTNGFYRVNTGKSGVGTYSKTATFPQSSNPSMGTCQSLYCHSNGISTYSNPTWAGAAMPATCTGCHGGNNSSGAAIAGKHTGHFTTANVGRVLNCRDCHNATVTSSTDRTISTPANHVTGSLNVKFDNSLNLNSDNPTYNGQTTTVANGAAVPPGTYGVCNNVYCHSSGNLFNISSGTGTIVVSGSVPTFKQPNWSTTTIGCAGCHGDGSTKAYPVYATGSAGSTTANSHVQHIESGGASCDDCHIQTTVSTTISVGTMTLVPAGLHLNRKEDVTFKSTSGPATYNATKTCSSTYCHGSTSNTGTWGGNTTNASCTKCHGVPSTVASYGTTSDLAAPGYNGTGVNTAGLVGTITSSVSNDGAVGAHDTHLRALNSYATTTLVQCSNCHTVPASSTSSGHNDSALPAELAFTGLSVSNGISNASYTYSSRTCNNIYCHGGKMPYGSTTGADTSPTWTQQTYLTGTPALAGDCNRCHGAPPTGYTGNSHSGTETFADCNGCHSHVALTTGVITDKSKHINGVVEATGTCIGCHSQVQTGTHGTPRDAVMNEFGLTWGHKRSGRGPVADADCIVCHLEGDFSTQKQSAKHKDGNIDLRDPDGVGEAAITNMSGGAFLFTKFSTTYVAGSRTSTGNTSNNVDNVVSQKFCLACHDSNGATNTTARSTNGGTPTAFMPWGGVNLGANYTVANGAAAAGGLINVKSQLTTTNSSAHPVLGPRNKDFPTTARFNDPYKPAGTRGTSGTLSQGVVMNCFDCHNTAAKLTNRTVASHGNAVTIPGVLTVTGTPAAGTNQVTFCIVCHIGYDTSTSSHHNTGSALSAATNNGMTIYLRYACNVCHGSTYNTAAVRPVRGMDVHGVNVLPSGGLTKVNRWAGNSVGTPAQVNARPYAFIRNTEILTEHNPLKIGGSTYTPGCTMANGTPNCSRAFQSITPGGTYP